MNWSPLIVFMVGFLPFCCHTSEHAQKSSAELVSESLYYDGDHVLILLLDFTPDSATIRSARLIEGTFEPLEEELSSKDFVSIQYLDGLQKVLFEKIIDHPLIQYAEYTDKDGTIYLRQSIKERGTIMIRSQHLTNVRMIRVSYGRKKNYRRIAVLPVKISDPDL